MGYGRWSILWCPVVPSVQHEPCRTATLIFASHLLYVLLNYFLFKVKENHKIMLVQMCFWGHFSGLVLNEWLGSEIC